MIELFRQLEKKSQSIPGHKSKTKMGSRMTSCFLWKNLSEFLDRSYFGGWNRFEFAWRICYDLP